MLTNHLLVLLSVVLVARADEMLTTMSTVATTMSARTTADIEHKERSTEAQGGIFDRSCDCESDVGDSCNQGDDPCCSPLQCTNGQCQPQCRPVGTPCVPALNQCCVLVSQSCQFNPAVKQAVCSFCVQPYARCNPYLLPGIIGSCCFGFVCSNVGFGAVCLPPGTPRQRPRY